MGVPTQGCLSSAINSTTLTPFVLHAAPYRSIVYLEIDNRLCTLDSCFPTADSAAEYLGALSAVDMLRLPYPIKEVRSEYR